MMERLRSSAAATTGHGVGDANIAIVMPKPNVNVSRSRAVIERAAGTVSSSGPSMRRSTLRLASSGSSRSTGSSRSIRPSPAIASVAAAVIGLLVEAIRKIESCVTGAPPIARLPSASTWTSSPHATSATSPGMSVSPTCSAAASWSRARPVLVRRSATGEVPRSRGALSSAPEAPVWRSGAHCRIIEERGRACRRARP
jgi:hypothetical protein